MGYDLHITRRKRWTDYGNNITAKEWLALVKSDPELKIDRKQGCYFAIWSGKCTLESPWLDWSDGKISTKNPDDALIDKMVEIARKLNAVVQGDEGEIYKSAKDAHRQYNPSKIIALALRVLKQKTKKLKDRIIKSLTIPYYQPPPFKRGDRLIDSSGFEFTVDKIDRKDFGGIGIAWAKNESPDDKSQLGIPFHQIEYYYDPKSVEKGKEKEAWIEYLKVKN